MDDLNGLAEVFSCFVEALEKRVLIVDVRIHRPRCLSSCLPMGALVQGLAEL